MFNANTVKVLLLSISVCAYKSLVVKFIKFTSNSNKKFKFWQFKKKKKKKKKKFDQRKFLRNLKVTKINTSIFFQNTELKKNKYLQNQSKTPLAK